MMRYIILTAGLLVSGCASIVSGSTQSLSVETKSPDGKQVIGANCKMVNDKGTWFTTTPGTVPVHRSYEDLTVSCSKDAFQAAILVVKSGTKAMAAGNILFGGIIGGGVDVATGAAYDYPDLISVQMSSITDSQKVSSK